jgi:hypothetical protein
MKLERFDSPEVARAIASTEVRACWGWSAWALVAIASVLGLLIVLVVSFVATARAAIWLSAPIVLALNALLLWRARSSRLNWVLAAGANRVYVRLFAWRGRSMENPNEPDVLMLEASEILSMSAQTVEVFLDGSEARVVEQLVIEPTQMTMENRVGYVPSLQCGNGHCGTRLFPMDKQSFVGIHEGRLVIEWKPCRPQLREFLRQVAQECPNISIAHLKCPELDLNGIWRGISKNLRKDLSVQERRKLVQATRLGLGWDCTRLLVRYRHISFHKAAAYLAEIEREETATGQDSEARNNVTTQNLHL